MDSLIKSEIEFKKENKINSEISFIYKDKKYYSEYIDLEDGTLYIVNDEVRNLINALKENKDIYKLINENGEILYFDSSEEYGFTNISNSNQMADPDFTVRISGPDYVEPNKWYEYRAVITPGNLIHETPGFWLIWSGQSSQYSASVQNTDLITSPKILFPIAGVYDVILHLVTPSMMQYQYRYRVNVVFGPLIH